MNFLVKTMKLEILGGILVDENLCTMILLFTKLRISNLEKPTNACF